MRLFPCFSLQVSFRRAPRWAGPVDINTADATTLARELNGVGPARAQAIVAYRTEHGPFKSVDDLALVKNMPQKVIDSEPREPPHGGSRRARASKPGAKPAGKAEAAEADAKAAPRP